MNIYWQEDKSIANRNFNRKQALEKEIKEIYAQISIGAAGAPTLQNQYGVASVSRTGAGDYRITLQDKYMSLKMVEGVFKSSSAQDIRVQVKAEDVDGAKTVDIYTLTGATPTDPASGQVLLLKFDLKNTSVV